MAEQKVQGVQFDVGAELGKAWITLRTEGANSITITVDPQAAFDMGEKLARAAHTARFGTAVPDDMVYLHQQIKSRVTGQLQALLVNRVALMLNSLREDRSWSNKRLARELVDTVLTKVE